MPEGGGIRREEKSKAMFRIQHYGEILFEGTGQGFPGKGQKVIPMILGIWGHRVKVAVLQPYGMGRGEVTRSPPHLVLQLKSANTPL